MSGNALVAERVDTTSPLAGSGMLEDGQSLVNAIESGSWLDGGMATFSLAVDTAATVSDPLGSLIAAGLGWLMDHLEPLNGWLEDLTGDADEVRAFARTWANVAEQLGGAGQEIARKVEADLGEMLGQAAEAYRNLSGDLAEHLGARPSGHRRSPRVWTWPRRSCRSCTTWCGTPWPRWSGRSSRGPRSWR